MRATKDRRSVTVTNLATAIVGALAAAALGACANSTTDDAPLGTDDNQDSAVPTLDASRADRSTPEFDGSTSTTDAGKDSSAKDSGSDAGPKDSGSDADSAVVD